MNIDKFGELLNAVVSTAPDFNEIVDGNAYYKERKAMAVSFKDGTLIGIRFELIKGADK